MYWLRKIDFFCHDFLFFSYWMLLIFFLIRIIIFSFSSFLISSYAPEHSTPCDMLYKIEYKLAWKYVILYFFSIYWFLLKWIETINMLVVYDRLFKWEFEVFGKWNISIFFVLSIHAWDLRRNLFRTNSKFSQSYYCFLKIRVNSNVLFRNFIFFSINLKQILWLKKFEQAVVVE